MDPKRREEIRRLQEEQRASGRVNITTGTSPVVSKGLSVIPRPQSTDIVDDQPSKIQEMFGLGETSGDLVGNIAAGFFDQLMLPTFIDVASEVRDEGVYVPGVGQTKDFSSDVFGSEDWADESLAGKIGYGLGSAFGLFTGVGAVSTLLRGGSKLAGVAGLKYAGKKVAEAGGEAISQDVGEAIVNRSSKIIKDASKARANSLYKPYNIRKKAHLTKNPLADEAILINAQNTLKKDLAEKFGNQLTAKQLDELARVSLKEGADYINSNFSSSIYGYMVKKGFSDKVARFTSSSAYESTLLATHQWMIGEGSELITKGLLGNEIEEEVGEGLFMPGYKRAIQGATLGFGLGLARLIPGGKNVQFSKSIGAFEYAPVQGSLADAMTMGKVIKNRFSRTSKMKPKQLQRALYTQWVGSGKSSKWMRDELPGFAKNILRKNADDLTTQDINMLREAWKVTRKNTPKVIADLAKEIKGDLKGSFPRMFVGSLIMNAQSFYDRGGFEVIGTDQYPTSEFLTDFLTGMIYTKRGVGMVTKPKAPRYFKETGMDANGYELESYVKSLEILGYNDEAIGPITALTGKGEAEILASIERSDFTEGTPDAKVLFDQVYENTVTGSEYVNNIDPEKKPWQVHAAEEKISLIRELENADAATKDQIEKRLSNIEKQEAIVSYVEEAAMTGIKGQRLKDMSKDEALAYLSDVSSGTLDNKPLNPLTVREQIEDALIKSANTQTEDTYQVMKAYIEDSMAALGYPIDQSQDGFGRPILHQSLLDLVATQKTAKQNESNEHIDAADMLYEVLSRAGSRESGMINVTSGEGGLRWNEAATVTAEQRTALKDIYNSTMDYFHTKYYNDGNIRWNQSMPLYNGIEGGFSNPNLLSSDIIFMGIGKYQNFKRHQDIYNVFTNKNNDHGAERSALLSPLFKGNGTAIPKVEDLANFSPDDKKLLRRINNIKSMLDPYGGSATSIEVSASELKNFSTKLIQSFGTREGQDIFTNDQSYNEFKAYMNRQIIKDLTGNQLLDSGLRNALSLAFTPDNPIASKANNKLRIVRAKKLEEILLKAEATGSVDNPVTESTLNLLNDYKTIVEDPLIKATASNKNITFVDREIPIEFYSTDMIKSQIKEMINAASFSDISQFNTLQNTVSHLGEDIAVKIESLKKLSTAAKDRKLTDDLAISAEKLTQSYSNLKNAINMYSSTGDAVGLRSMLDNVNDLRKMQVKLRSDINLPETIKNTRDVIDEFVTKHLEINNSKYDLRNMEDVENYIQEAERSLDFEEQSQKVHSKNTSISDSQYALRWLDGDVSQLEILKKNPIELLRNVSDLSQQAQNVIKRFDELKGTDKEISSFDEFKRKTNIDTDLYIDLFIKPIVEGRKSIIEAKYNALTRAEKDKSSYGSAADMYDNYVLDTMQILQSGLANTKFPMVIFNNGTFEISYTNISSWDRGVNSLRKNLNLTTPGHIALIGTKFANEKTIRTRHSVATLNDMFNKIKKGTATEINVQSLLSDNDKALLKDFGPNAFGTGQDGTAQYRPIVLDEKSMIVVHQAAYDNIVNSFSAADSDNRKYLNNLVGEANANAYLSKLVDASINEDGHALIKPIGKNVDSLVLLTRLMHAMPHKMPEVITKGMDIDDTRSMLKYIKLDSPRTGMALNKDSADFAQAYLKKVLPKGHIMQSAFNTFKKQTFNEDGSLKPQRVLTIRDEKGAGDYFFDTQVRGIDLMTKQLIEKRKLSPEVAEKEARTIMDKYEPIAASIVNGEKYLSKPEFIAQLVQKGAHPDFFEFNKNGSIKGFKVAIKPVEYDAQVKDNGELSVYIGKTAYKYSPAFDAMMKDSQGNYVMDAITFKSSVKENAFRSGSDADIVEKMLELPEGLSLDNNWIDVLGVAVRDNFSAKDHIYNLPRESIFIKSISSEHEATASAAFTNFTTNDALTAMNKITNMQASIDDAVTAYKSLDESLFATRNIANLLKGPAYEAGDNMMQAIGVEGILQSGGIPSFEYMAPQLQRSIVSEYLGKRNWVSSKMKNGSYPVMTSGEGYSLPIIEDNVRRTHGGSGMSGQDWNKSVSGLFGGSNEGVSLVFTVDDAIVSKHKNVGLQPGDDITVTFDGEVLFPGLLAGKSKDFNPLKKELLGHFNSIIKDAKATKGIETVGDFISFVDGTLGMPLKKNKNGDIVIENGDNSYSKKIAINNNQAYQAIHLATVDLRTPMAGINDRVITKTERLLNRERGPVSEINFLDVIDPQDADFDLDKSSRFFALPGQVMKEIYYLSGHMDPASDVFFRELDSVAPTSNRDMAKYRVKMEELASKRGIVVRAHSVNSILYQMAAAEARTQGKDPVDYLATEQVAGKSVFSNRENNVKYDIVYKEGRDQVNSVQFVKKLVKETIDIYKRYGDIAPNEIENYLFYSDKAPFRARSSELDDISFQELQNNAPETYRQYQNLVNRIVRPLGELFNLTNMGERMSDGTVRKMNMWEINSTFQNIKRKIKLAGDSWSQGKDGRWTRSDTPLKGFSDQVLGFLGEKTAELGTSRHPLVQGLIKIEEGLKQNFTYRQNYGGAFARAIESKTKLQPEQVSNAIKGILSDQKRYMEVEYLAWEIEQIEDSMASLRAYGKAGSQRYRNLKTKLENSNMLYQTFNEELTNKEIGVRKPAKRNQKNKVFKMPVTILRQGRPDPETGRPTVLNTGRFADANQPIDIFKGDIAVTNYKKLKVENSNVVKQRRAMHNAFARQLSTISDGEMNAIEILFKDYKRKVFQAPSSIYDANTPTSFNKFGIINEAKLSVLSDYLKRAYNSAEYGRGTEMQKQFLMRVLTPDLELNTFSVTGYDLDNNPQITPAFKPNKQNERLVFTLLDRAKLGHGTSLPMEASIGKDIHQFIVDAHKRALVLEYNPSLKGDVFNVATKKRDPRDASLMALPNDLPEFMMNPDENYNQKAVNVLRSMLTGTYHMSDAEIYRMTYKMYENNLGEVPNPSEVSKLMNSVWQGETRRRIDPSSQHYGTDATYKETSNYQSDTKSNAVYELKKKFRPGDC